jgi:HSP20 family molecular chaperone IbpA
VHPHFVNPLPVRRVACLSTVNYICLFGGELLLVCSLFIKRKIEKTEMKGKGMISEELLHSIDILNTLNGGTSEPLIELEQYENYREVRCAVPGVHEGALLVEIHNNFLSIYYMLPIESDGKQVRIPRVAYYKPIPYFIDVAKISATVEDRFLLVKLPFNELANGYHKKISIKN